MAERAADDRADAAGWPRIHIVREEWADDTVPLPTYATDGAAGADVRANLPPETRRTGVTLASGEWAVVPTGLRVEIPDGYEVQVRARSGLAAQYGIGLANGIGTIDSDYRGPLGVILINHGRAPFTVEHGDRLAQLVVAPVIRAVFALGESLSDTRRGGGGFGSTGRR